jgi:hypothetical protein
MKQHVSSHARYGAALCAALLTFCGVLPASAQMRFTGQASVGFVKADQSASQYSYNGGRGSFNWRADLFADAVVADDITFFANARLEQDNQLHLDQFALRMSRIASSPLSLELGEIEMPFLSLGERRYPKNNPFIGLPLLREHRTTLRSSDYELWLLDSRYTQGGNGFRLLDGGLYDLGFKLFASAGIFDVALAVTNGMVSASSSYSPGGLNPKSGFGKLVRLAATPAQGLTIGVSYANGPFLSEGSTYYPSYGTAFDPALYSQEIVGGDIDFSIGHLSVYGEAIYNVWKFQEIYGSDLKAAGYSLEARYALLPRLSIAARAGGIAFSRIDAVVVAAGYGTLYYDGPWDHDLWRFEGAIGYRLNRETLVKLVYEWNHTLGVRDDPADNVFTVQAVVSF